MLRSRMAAMMFTLLMRSADSVTVKKVMTKPNVYPIAAERGVTRGLMLRSAASTSRSRTTPASSNAAATPRAMPTAAAIIA